MTMIHVKCPNCGQPIEMPEEGRGEKIACPTCQQEFTAWEIEGQGREGAIERAQAELKNGAAVREQRKLEKPQMEVEWAAALRTLPPAASQNQWVHTKGVADGLSRVSMICFALAVAAGIGGAVVLMNDGGPWVMWIGGALFGAALFCFLAAQITHIRAAVERMAQGD